MFVRPLSVLLTLAAFFVHVAGGCCVHHAHASDVALSNGSCSGSAAVTACHAEEAACCAVATSDESGNPADQEPCEDHGNPHQLCGEGACSFDGSSKVKLPLIGVAAAMEMVTSVDFSLTLRQTATQASQDSPFGAGSANRAQQLLQTWLL